MDLIVMRLFISVAVVTEAYFKAVMSPSAGEWPTYNGALNGNRHSSLAQITAANVGRLQLQWSWSNAYQLLEMTPLVMEGVMYVTGPNQVCALDAAAGRTIWCYSRT